MDVTVELEHTVDKGAMEGLQAAGKRRLRLIRSLQVTERNLDAVTALAEIWIMIPRVFSLGWDSKLAR